MKKQTIQFAHRGYSLYYPENTYIAFKQAYLNNFDGVEFDVHLTLDGNVVIIHDEDLERTSNLTGKVYNKNLDELKKGIYSSKFNNPKSTKYDDQSILTLEEFLEYFVDKFKYINIEIKTIDHRCINDVRIEEKIVEIINPYLIKSNFIISSFSKESILKIKELNNNIEIGLLIDEKRNFNETNNKQILNKIDYLNIELETLIKNNFFENIKKPIIGWTSKSKIYDKKIEIKNYLFGLIWD